MRPDGAAHSDNPVAVRNSSSLGHYLSVKNWNLFAGDPKYKTNFFLQFITPATASRYQETLLIRRSNFARAFIIFQALTCLCLLPFQEQGFSANFLILAVIGFTGSIFVHYWSTYHWIIRLAYLVPEIVWTETLFGAAHHKSAALYLVFSYCTSITIGTFYSVGFF